MNKHEQLQKILESIQDVRVYYHYLNRDGKQYIPARHDHADILLSSKRGYIADDIMVALGPCQGLITERDITGFLQDVEMALAPVQPYRDRLSIHKVETNHYDRWMQPEKCYIALADPFTLEEKIGEESEEVVDKKLFRKIFATEDEVSHLDGFHHRQYTYEAKQPRSFGQYPSVSLSTKGKKSNAMAFHVMKKFLESLGASVSKQTDPIFDAMRQIRVYACPSASIAQELVAGTLNPRCITYERILQDVNLWDRLSKRP